MRGAPENESFIMGKINPSSWDAKISIYAMAPKEGPSQCVQLNVAYGEAIRYHYERFLEHAPRLFLEPERGEKFTVVRDVKPCYVEENVKGSGNALLRRLPFSFSDVCLSKTRKRIKKSLSALLKNVAPLVQGVFEVRGYILVSHEKLVYVPTSQRTYSSVLLAPIKPYINCYHLSERLL